MNSMPDFLNNEDQPDMYSSYQEYTTEGLPQNGRVSFLERKSAGGALGQGYNGFLFPNQSEQPGLEGDMLRGNFEENTLTKVYFSSENIQLIQNKIRYAVYQRSGNKWVIDPQSTDELKIIMRAMYYQYGKNLCSQITQQVAELNKQVVEWIVPRIFMEVKQHFFYIDDISKMPRPLSHPISMSSAGSKTPKNPVFFNSAPTFESPANEGFLPRMMPHSN